MKPELQNKLFESYPSIFRQKDLPMSQTCMCWGIDTGDGWYNILDTLCNQIQNHLEHNLREDQDPTAVNVEATQVKEKFGGLRFYYDGGDKFIEGLVWMAEAISSRTCEGCGSSGTQNNTGWIHTLCPLCRDARARSPDFWPDKDNIMNKDKPNEQDINQKQWIVKVEHLDDTDPDRGVGELCIRFPDELMEQLGWEIGDEVEWVETEISKGWGDHKGCILSNLTKNPKQR
jgi:hypothetical protein